MSDAERLETWTPRYEEWRARALPMIGDGKTKEAFASYPWFETEGDPFARLEKPAAEARFALITTGGYSIAGEQEPMKPIPNFGGDAPQVREIPLDVDRAKLEINHPGYDHRFAKEDINVNLPLDRLRELAEAGEIGSVAPMTHVLMGLVVDVAPLLRATIPHLIDRLRSDSVEAALLVPS
ncbi:MAG: glycine/betaine/sarcosine/D-proline family reductase selenoprotein B [Proteobacteria bacterium]|nr:glycine/betaine/sarcosine/D-proline family reductase selenoprotein B [Pseudomonadota bacterium]